MRITIISMTSYATPPKTYGGEIFIWDLAEAFSILGHEVHLFAAPGSLCPPGGKLTYLKGQYGVGGNRAVEREVCEFSYLREVFKGDYIIDASHEKMLMQDIASFFPDAMPRTIGILNGLVTHTPMSQKWNLVVGSECWKRLSIEGKSQFFGTPWQEQYGAHVNPLPPESIVQVIPWATNCEFYTPSDYEKDSYFLWLARPTPYKGLHKALQLAVETGITLKIAMPMEIPEHLFFGQQYLTQIEEARERRARVEIVKLPGDSRHHQLKRQLYRQAKSLLVTIEAHEPFGLTVIESLACGTPVIASHMGAMPEIIQEGRTGYLAHEDDGFKNAIQWIDEGKIDPIECRRDAVERFDRMVAAKRFLELYHDLMMKYHGFLPSH